MEYDNTNRGAIWKNEERQTEKHPHFRGSLNVEGVDYWVSAWLRDEGANPKAPALKFVVQKKEEAHDRGMSEARAAVDPADFNDDIPF